MIGIPFGLETWGRTKLWLLHLSFVIILFSAIITHLVLLLWHTCNYLVVKEEEESYFLANCLLYSTFYSPVLNSVLCQISKTTFEVTIEVTIEVKKLIF